MGGGLFHSGDIGTAWRIVTAANAREMNYCVNYGLYCTIQKRDMKLDNKFQAAN